MFIPEGIALYEVLPKQFYKDNKHHGNKLWMMFDYRLLMTVHWLRIHYGTVYLNNWYWGGSNQYRGWRPMDCGIGANFSQHKFGRALDMRFKSTTAKAIREQMLSSSYRVPFKFITGVEMDVSWLHIDVGNRNRHTSHLEHEVIQRIYI